MRKVKILDLLKNQLFIHRNGLYVVEAWRISNKNVFASKLAHYSNLRQGWMFTSEPETFEFGSEEVVETAAFIPEFL